jgi:hypothetical protein
VLLQLWLRDITEQLTAKSATVFVMKVCPAQQCMPGTAVLAGRTLSAGSGNAWWALCAGVWVWGAGGYHRSRPSLPASLRQQGGAGDSAGRAAAAAPGGGIHRPAAWGRGGEDEGSIVVTYPPIIGGPSAIGWPGSSCGAHGGIGGGGGEASGGGDSGGEPGAGGAGGSGAALRPAPRPAAGA